MQTLGEKTAASHVAVWPRIEIGDTVMGIEASWKIGKVDASFVFAGNEYTKNYYASRNSLVPTAQPGVWRVVVF